MSRHEPLQPLASDIEQPVRSKHRTNKPVPHRRSPWADSLEAADYTRCVSRETGAPSREAFLAWAKRRGLVPVYRGRIPLFAWADIDEAMGLRVREARAKKSVSRKLSLVHDGGSVQEVTDAR